MEEARQSPAIQALLHLAALYSTSSSSTPSPLDNKLIVLGAHELEMNVFEDAVVVFSGPIPGMSQTTAKATVAMLGALSTPNIASILVLTKGTDSNKERQARDRGITVVNSDVFAELVKDIVPTVELERSSLSDTVSVSDAMVVREQEILASSASSRRRMRVSWDVLVYQYQLSNVYLCVVD